MKNVLRLLAFTTLFFVHGNDASAKSPENDSGLVVHEWGIFRVHNDRDMANADLRADWDDLPEFAYGHIKGRAVPLHWDAFEIRKKPIIFFHAKEATTVRVKIDFPGGLAGVWFPATVRPAVLEFERQPPAAGTLEWNIGVKAPPANWRPKTPTVPSVSERSWINRVRQVKSDEIFSQFGFNQADVEREKFIYYDGIFPQGKWLKIAVEKNRVSLTSLVKHPVFDVTVVDRRGEGVRVGRIAKLNAGESIKDVSFQEVNASRFTAEASDVLVKQLTGAGLYEDEAKSLADLSRKELFETPGLHLFFRIPQEEYDARLPLTLTPKPESVVRAGLVVYGHLEPDFAERILALVQRLDAPKFANRDAAMKELFAIGPAALVHIQKIRDRGNLSVEVRERVDALIRKWSTKEAFDQ